VVRNETTATGDKNSFCHNVSVINNILKVRVLNFIYLQLQGAGFGG
jgi:hypothetical protein